jgi:hypothetical protein
VTRYLDDLRQAKPFVRHDEGPIRLHGHRGSAAEQDRRVVLQRRRVALARIEQFFGRKAPWPVSVFLYPSWTAAGRYPIGTAAPAMFACFSAYTAGRWAYERHHEGHELTHLFSNTDAAHQQVFVVGILDEGLAEYLSGWAVDPHLRVTQHWQGHGVPFATIRIRQRALHYRSPSVYQMGGSFVKFLVESQPRGRERLLALLERTRLATRYEVPRIDQFQDAAAQIFGVPWAVLEHQWNRVLAPYWRQTYPVEPRDLSAVRTVVQSAGHGQVTALYLEGFKHHLVLVAHTDAGRMVAVQATRQDGWAVLWRRPLPAPGP